MNIYIIGYYIALICLLILSFSGKMFFLNLKGWQKVVFIIAILALVIPCIYGFINGFIQGFNS